jgi:hypothetical protein
MQREKGGSGCNYGPVIYQKTLDGVHKAKGGEVSWVRGCERLFKRREGLVLLMAERRDRQRRVCGVTTWDEDDMT